VYSTILELPSSFTVKRLQWTKIVICLSYVVLLTGTCFIQKIYAPSSSLLQGKHLPFTPFPLRLNIFRLFVILSLTQLSYHIFLSSAPPHRPCDLPLYKSKIYISQWWYKVGEWGLWLWHLMSLWTIFQLYCGEVHSKYCSISKLLVREKTFFNDLLNFLLSDPYIFQPDTAKQFLWESNLNEICAQPIVIWNGVKPGRKLQIGDSDFHRRHWTAMGMV
jgi:hypothetical protein